MGRFGGGEDMEDSVWLLARALTMTALKETAIKDPQYFFLKKKKKSSKSHHLNMEFFEQ